MISRLLKISFCFLAACSSLVLADTEVPALRLANTLSSTQAGSADLPAVPVTTRTLPAAGHDQLIENPRVPSIDTNVATTDLWSRIRMGFGIQDLSNANVERHLNTFRKHPTAVSNTLERGRKYLFHIVTELEKRGLPTELALLPLVESAYNPQAVSSAKAAGLWQFIPSTGKDFRLQQNWWVDERRDVLASTEAALTYLNAVYELHGDWHLALASYNWGENAVMRAVNSNRNAGKPTDFNSLRMPAETSQYVPKLQAIKMVIANPEHYGIKLPDIPNEPYFVTIERTQGMDLALAAKLAEMPLNDFLALNPAYNRPIIPGNHDADLLLPVAHAERFQANLAAHGGPLLSWKTYSLPRSERVEQVAQRLRMSPDALRKANGLPPKARLASGYTLLVPHATDVTAPIEASNASTARRQPTRALNKATSRVSPKPAKPRRG